MDIEATKKVGVSSNVNVYSKYRKAVVNMIDTCVLYDHKINRTMYRTLPL